MCSVRYSFFRDSTGQPYKREDGKHSPEALLRVMGECSFLQEDGGIAWQNLPFDSDLLYSSIAINEAEGQDLNDRDLNKIVWKALGEVARKYPGKALKPSDVLKACDVLAAAFFRLPNSRYSLVTSLSVERLPATRIKVRDSSIVSMPDRQRKYRLPSALDSPHHRQPFEEHLSSTRYHRVRVDTSGRSTDEAVTKALDDLNLVRSLWSLGATKGRRTIWFSERRRPIGVIHTGPLYTLHHPNGEPADEFIYYYDPNYLKDFDLFDDRGRWDRIEKDRSWATKRLSRLPFGNELRVLLLRYIRALDEPNDDVACLQLWGILEKITDTIGAQYDLTVKRASWIYSEKDRPLAREIFEAFRLHRNRFVHSGITDQGQRNMASLIKTLIDPHLVRLLENSLKLQSLKEYGEFLSYPTDASKLRKMRRWSSVALNRPT